MKFITICLLSFISLTSFGQTKSKNWEKALSAVIHQNEVLVQTTIEFNNVALTKEQTLELIAAFDSKEQFVDYVFTEGKTIVIYHYQSLDDSGIKSFIVPIRSDFNLVKTKILNQEEIEAIYTSL